jgi:KEOPS complex subunit Pcc1
VTHDAVLSFDYSTPDIAARVERSVRPEVGDIQGDRTRATIDRTGDCVTVTVAADDLVALRAGLNTWSTLVRVAEATSGD